MTDFEVVWKRDGDETKIVVSKVYAVDGHAFLIIDRFGKFKWVDMRDCVLKDIWENPCKVYER